MKNLLLTIAIASCFHFTACKNPSSSDGRDGGGITSGGATALPWLGYDKKFFFQEYWHAGTPHYLFFNQDSDPAQIDFYQRSVPMAVCGNVSPGDTHHLNLSSPEPIHVSGPWSIPSRSSGQVSVKELAVQSYPTSPSYLTITLNQGKGEGAIKPPLISDGERLDPNVFSMLSFMNGGFFKQTNVWFELESLFVQTEKVFVIELKVTGDFFNIELLRHKTDLALPIPSFDLVKVTSSDLRVEHSKTAFTIYPDNNAMDKIYTLRLEVKAPKIKEETMAYLAGILRTGAGGNAAPLTVGAMVTP